MSNVKGSFLELYLKMRGLPEAEWGSVGLQDGNLVIQYRTKGEQVRTDYVEVLRSLDMISAYVFETSRSR